MQMIKVKINSKQWDNLVIQIHSQMTAKELRQFIQASTILQGDLTLNSSRQVPLVLLFSSRKNLFIDYLLTETNVAMSKIHSLERINAPSISLSFTSKQSNFVFLAKDRAKALHPSHHLQLEMVSFNQRDNNQILAYLNLAYKKQRKSLVEKKESQFSVDVKSQVVFRMEQGRFFTKMMIQKSSMKCFSDLQKMMTVKERMIRLSMNHVSIFGVLFQTNQSEQNLVFYFNYVPKIRLRQIFRMNQKKNINLNKFADKIWLFINSLRFNGFESFIMKLIEEKKVQDLLDKLSLDFREQIVLEDIFVSLEQQFNFDRKLSLQQENQLLMQIHKYVKNNSKEELGLKETSEKSQLIEIKDFFNIFNRQNYAATYLREQNYQPLSNFFNWKISNESSSLLKDICEASTNKKKKNRQKEMDKKMKKKKQRRNSSIERQTNKIIRNQFKNQNKSLIK